MSVRDNKCPISSAGLSVWCDQLCAGSLEDLFKFSNIEVTGSDGSPHLHGEYAAAAADGTGHI